MRLFFRLIKYLFPKRYDREKVPLMARGYTSPHRVYGDPALSHETICRALVAANCARDIGHAYMIIKNEPLGTPLAVLIRKYKRPRRFRNRIVNAFIRLRRILWVIMVCVWLIPYSVTGAQDAPKAEALADLEVRACPKMSCEVIGQIAAGGRFVLSGQDHGWVYFLYWDQDGWVKYDPALMTLNVEIETLPVVRSQTLQPVIVEGWTIEPLQPAPGQAYTLALNLKSLSDAPTFALGVLFPGGQFVYVSVPPMISGSSGMIRVPASGEVQTGQGEIVVILDIDQQLTPTPDESQRLLIPVRIDRPYRVQGTLTLKGATTIDLEGGAPDLEWDGLNFEGKLLVIEGLGQAHYDALAGLTVQSIPAAQGMILGVITAEGQRGIIRVVKVSDETEIFYALY